MRDINEYSRLLCAIKMLWYLIPLNGDIGIWFQENDWFSVLRDTVAEETASPAAHQLVQVMIVCKAENKHKASECFQTCLN